MRYGSAIWFLLSSLSYIRENVEPFLSLVSRVKTFALPLLAETSNDDTTPIQRQISCNIQNDNKTCVNANIYSI